MMLLEIVPNLEVYLRSNTFTKYLYEVICFQKNAYISLPKCVPLCFWQSQCLCPASAL